MSEAAVLHSRTAAERRLEAGSSGWTVHELNQVHHESAWETEHYELVSGVIVKMPPTLYGGVGPAARLIRFLGENSEVFRAGIAIAEFDLLIAEDTIVRPDYVWMSPADEANHRVRAPEQGRPLAKSRLAVPPTLIIESVSEGHERHDRVLKFGRYAEFGVGNYWIIDGFEKRLDCYGLVGTQYVAQAQDQSDGVVKPALFSPIAIPLRDLWID